MNMGLIVPLAQHMDMCLSLANQKKKNMTFLLVTLIGLGMGT